MFNFFDFQANAMLIFEPGGKIRFKFTQEEIDKREKSPTYVFSKQNKNIINSENLSLEEKIEILNNFFASIEISEEDKDYLTKEILAGDFSFGSNIKLINSFYHEKDKKEFLENYDNLAQQCSEMLYASAGISIEEECRRPFDRPIMMQPRRPVWPIRISTENIGVTPEDIQNAMNIKPKDNNIELEFRSKFLKLDRIDFATSPADPIINNDESEEVKLEYTDMVNRDKLFEEKMKILNEFFLSKDLSEEDKNYLTKLMPDSYFNLNSNLRTTNDFDIKKRSSSILNNSSLSIPPFYQLDID